MLNQDGTLVDTNGFILQPEFAVPIETGDLHPKKLNVIGYNCLGVYNSQMEEVATSSLAQYQILDSLTNICVDTEYIDSCINTPHLYTEDYVFNIRKVQIGNIDYYILDNTEKDMFGEIETVVNILKNPGTKNDPVNYGLGGTFIPDKVYANKWVSQKPHRIKIRVEN